ncbi:MAG: hypothetical protein JXR96_06330 [Deltaproteobacteria bacterium]|nr:hypothetical protein [Deltaproteobacteria bacterium]
MRTPKSPASMCLAIALVLGLAVPASAGDEGKKRARKWYETSEGEMSTGLGFDVPIIGNSAGFLGGLGVGYNIWKYVDASIGWSFAVDENGDSCPGNLTLGLTLFYFSENGKGTTPAWDFNTGLSINAGLGFTDISGLGSTHAAEVGRAVNMGWLYFMTESAVVKPDFFFSLHGPGFSVGTGIGYYAAAPLFDQDVREMLTALQYRFGISIYLFGDQRGGLSASVGFTGLKELDGEENHNYLVNVGLGLRIRSIGLRTGFNVGIPMGDETAGVSAVIGFGASYEFEIYRPAEIGG